MPAPQFEVVRDDLPDPLDSGRAEPAVGLLTLALKALSQRAMAAAATLFTFTTMLGAWYLWFLTPDPSPTQIISLTIFALFVLAANWLVRRK